MTDTTATPTSSKLRSPPSFSEHVSLERPAGGRAGIPLQFRDISEEVLSSVRELSVTWEIRDASWSIVGSKALRFAGVNGGGNVSGMPRVAVELGWSLLLVDGQCRYWSAPRPDGPVRTGTLSDAQAADLVRELDVDHWTEANAGCADASTLLLRFIDRRASISCTSTPSSRAYDHWMEMLFATGHDVTGAVRYSISDTSNDAWVVSGVTTIAAPWPLAVDPASLAVAQTEELSADPQMAASPDADTLQSVRKAYLQESLNSAGPWLRIPVKVVGAGGAPTRYFDLAMRDVLPFETNGQIAPDDFFLQ